MSHSRWPVSIRSSPTNASIRIIDRKGKEVHAGSTPANLDLRSGSGFFHRARYDVLFNLPGYAEHKEVIEYKVNGWYWGNILIGGGIGMLIVDPATGAMYKVRNPLIHAYLTEQTSSIEGPGPRVIELGKVPKVMLDDLEPLRN